MLGGELDWIELGWAGLGRIGGEVMMILIMMVMVAKMQNKRAK